MSNGNHPDRALYHETIKAHVYAENTIMIGPSGDAEATDTRRMMIYAPRGTRSRVHLGTPNIPTAIIPKFTHPEEFVDHLHHAVEDFHLIMVRGDW